MSGPGQEALFNALSLEDHVPQGHVLRSIDRHLDPSSIRGYLAEVQSHTGRPSVDPELLIYSPAVHVYVHQQGMLLLGDCFGIRSERRLCKKVH